MNTSIIEKYMHQAIKDNYQNDKEKIEKSISDYKSCILNKYIKEYPLRLFSNYNLVKFNRQLRCLSLLPNIETYKEINRNNELFDATIFFPIHIGTQDCALQFPLILNISELSRCIDSQSINRVSFRTEDLIPTIPNSYQVDYEKDNKIRVEKMDILYKEKEKNPIIIMKASKLIKTTVINGNHRIIYCSKLKSNAVEGYYIAPEDCCKFALTKDYEVLYKLLMRLTDKVKGCINIEEIMF